MTAKHLLAAAAIIFALIQPAQAQLDEGVANDDISNLERCLNAIADPTLQEGYTCIGSVVYDCEGGTSQSIARMIECQRRENAAWRELTTRFETALRTHESRAQREKLERYLAQGEAWLSARCSYVAARYEGGSLSELTRETCANEHRGQIAIDLWLRVWHYGRF